MAKAAAATVNAGHNVQTEREQWQEQQFLNGLVQIKELKSDIAGQTGEIGQIYKRVKDSAGFTKADFKWAMELEDKDAAEIVATMERRLRIARMLGHRLSPLQRRIMKNLFLIAAIVTSSPAVAHEAHTGMKYEPFCCNGDNVAGDCQAIPSQRVRVVKGGYQVEIRPGDHRLVTVHHLYSMPQSEVRRSEDGDYHICLYPTEDTLRCMYAPDMGF